MPKNHFSQSGAKKYGHKSDFKAPVPNELRKLTMWLMSLATMKGINKSVTTPHSIAKAKNPFAASPWAG